MIPVEICVHSQSESVVLESVSAAWQGGASRIELCSDMANDGLTPPVSHIEVARRAFVDRAGLMVMIRPTPGGFFYDAETVRLMEKQISDAGNAGADGVVIGVLDPDTGKIDKEHCRRLVGKAKDRGMQITFHRAFDAITDWQNGLDDLIELGIDRVLTAGIPWGKAGTAYDGLNCLEHMLRHAHGEIELVVGGGVNLQNAPEISRALIRINAHFSLHTYSAVLESDVVSQQKVSLLRKTLTSLV
ncbi:copper homeostasis protein CutC [Endozoicomonas ascidiicola]|uniref:copper homeostasis protein CutC n=1 Tax=Endozoicomonas ascidiicola TaxID=1698521 RepID=UPI00082A324F|nr:copper homeostasis protein CutC [Endozoicomonas ascidiicola]